jgi:metal-responsive CopG/Arc/MetJ family transcriptional regulator
MKTTVPIPDRIFHSAEKLAARLGLSRSELYARAVANFVQKYREALIASQLNQVYASGGEDSTLDRNVAALQRRSLPRERW